MKLFLLENINKNKLNKIILISLILIFTSIKYSNQIFAEAYGGTGIVCTAAELLEELNEDLDDNNRLDCLLQSVQATEFDDTEEKQPNVSFLEFANLSNISNANTHRAKAHENNIYLWKSNCSFRAAEKNYGVFLRNYPLAKGLLDVSGNPINSPSPVEATLCVMVRSLIGNNLIPGITTTPDFLINISKGVLEQHLRCPGYGENSVCAATASYFLDEQAWVLFINPESISANGHPKFKSTDNLE